MAFNSITRPMKKKSFLYLSLISLLLTDCTHCISEFSYKPPENLSDGLATGSLKDVHIDTAIISRAIKKITCGKFNEVHSLLIYKDKMLVLEEYFQGHNYQWNAPHYYGELVQWKAEMLHPVMSCTKSFVSACIGIAIDKGFIDNVHQSIFDFLPDHQQYKYDNREYITIEHLLTMTCGLAWNEWGAPHGTSANDIDRLYFDCEDPIACVLERPWWAVPGEKFTYNGGGMVILGEILRHASKMNIDEFSKKYLLEPLKIDRTYWLQYPNGMYDTGGSMSLKPRDMLKLGVLYLNKGYWNGVSILPEEWVEKSSTVFNNNRGIKLPIEDSGKNGYGYTWWISELSHKGKKINMFRANGWGGQAIMVFPDLDMVVVFTGGNWAAKSSLFKILNRFILPAIE